MPFVCLMERKVVNSILEDIIMSPADFFNYQLQKCIMDLFNQIILPPRLIIGIQEKNHLVHIIAGEATTSFSTKISEDDFTEFLISKGGKEINDAYFDKSFDIPLSAFFSETT